MNDIAQLEQELSAAIATASDEAALETVRVGALGKSGSVTALLKTLGGLTPDERKVQGPAINGLKDRVNAASPGPRTRSERAVIRTVPLRHRAQAHRYRPGP